MIIETYTMPRPDWESWSDRINAWQHPPRALVALFAWESGGRVTEVGVWDSFEAIGDFYLKRITEALVAEVTPPEAEWVEPLAVYLRGGRKKRAGDRSGKEALGMTKEVTPFVGSRLARAALVAFLVVATIVGGYFTALSLLLGNGCAGPSCENRLVVVILAGLVVQVALLVLGIKLAIRQRPQWWPAAYLACLSFIALVPPISYQVIEWWARP